MEQNTQNQASPSAVPTPPGVQSQFDAIWGAKAPTPNQPIPRSQQVLSLAGSKYKDDTGQPQMPDDGTIQSTDNTATVGANLKGTLSDFRQNETQTENDWKAGNISMPHALFQTIGNVLGGAFSVPTDIAGPTVRNIAGDQGVDATEQGMSDAIDWASKPLADALANPEISSYSNAAKLYQKAGDLYHQANSSTDPAEKQRMTQLAQQVDKAGDVVKGKANEIQNGYATAGRDVNAVANIGTAAIGGPSVPEAAEGIAAAGSKVADTAKATVDKLTPEGSAKSATAEASEPDMMTYQNRIGTAQSEIYGKLSPGEKATVPLKDTGIGPFKKSVPDLTLSGRSKDIIDSVANLPEDIQIQRGDTLATKDSKLSQGISRLHSETDANLADPKMKAQTSFNDTRWKNYMRQNVLDPIKNELGGNSPEYNSALKAVNTAKSTLESNDASGVYRGRQSFDSQWERENPAMFRKAKSGMGALDPRASAAIEAGRLTRNAMNDFAEELLPDNHPFRSRMREESNLLQAKDEMRTRGASDVGKNSYTRFMNRHPIAKKAVNSAASAARVGGGIGIIDHL